MSTFPVMSQRTTEQQRSRYLALKARVDELTAGTEWPAHRGRGLPHIISYIQSRPHHQCCRQSTAITERQSDSFAVPETFDDSDASSSSESDGHDETLSPPDRPGSSEATEHDSSATSPIIYLAAPHTSQTAPTTPLSAVVHHTPSSYHVQLPSPILHTPLTDRSGAEHAQHPSPHPSSATSSTFSASSAASSDASPSSHTSQSMAGPTMRRVRSRRRSHSPSLPCTPISASVDYQRQTLSVYWPWSDNDSSHAQSVATETPAKQPQPQDASKTVEDAYDEQNDAIEDADEAEPGMSSRAETAESPFGVEQPGASPHSPAGRSVEKASGDEFDAPHEEDELEDEAATQADSSLHEQQDQAEERQENGDDAQRQLNTTSSSFPVAAVAEADKESDETNIQYAQSAASPAIDQQHGPTEASHHEQPPRLHASDEATKATEADDECGQQHVDSPIIPVRRTAARRQVLVLDDEDDSASGREAVAQENGLREVCDVSDDDLEAVESSADDDAATIPQRGGNARRRQIVSDEDSDDETSSASKQHPRRPAALQSPLRDITNHQLPTTRLPTTHHPFASPPPKPAHPPASFLFATPAAARQPAAARLHGASHFTHAVDGAVDGSGGRRTRSVTRSGMRGRGVACEEDVDEMDLYATPMIERIRQHKAALYNKQVAEEEQEEEDGQLDNEEEEEADDQNEYDDSFIASESGCEDSNESIYVDEEGEEEDASHPRPPRSQPSHSASAKRSHPPATSKPHASSRITASSSSSTSKACPVLTKHNRVQLARDVFAAVNRTAFSDRLPAELPVDWCNKLTTTAGHCRLLQGGGGTGRRCVITLAVKVIDSYERLRKTLAHEMCHAAAWLIDGCNRPPHGRTFRHYAQLCERTLRPPITISTCHTYAIYYPWRYRCTAPYCAQEVGRHTDSLDTATARCGHCGGRMVRLGRFARDGTPVAVRVVTGFAAFVKAEQARVRRDNPGTPQREVMGLLSAEWKRQRAAAVAVEAASVSERVEEDGEENQLVQRMLDLDVVDE